MDLLSLLILNSQLSYRNLKRCVLLFFGFFSGIYTGGAGTYCSTLLPSGVELSIVLNHFSAMY